MTQPDLFTPATGYPLFPFDFGSIAGLASTSQDGVLSMLTDKASSGHQSVLDGLFTGLPQGLSFPVAFLSSIVKTLFGMVPGGTAIEDLLGALGSLSGLSPAASPNGDGTATILSPLLSLLGDGTALFSPLTLLSSIFGGDGTATTSLANINGDATASPLSSALVTRNDGTAQITQTGSSQLFMGGDATAATPVSFLSNFLGFGGIFQGLLNSLFPTGSTGSALNSSVIPDIAFGMSSAIASVLDTFVNTFLGSTGSAFGISDLIRSIQSIPGANIIGTLAPSLTSNLGAGHVSDTTPELLTNGNFDTANSILGQSAWTWDGTQGPGTLMTSVYTDAAGILRELWSNVVHVSPGQKLNISANALWGNSFVGGANSIALTVAQFSGNVLSSYATIASVASPGSSGGWSALSGLYTVPNGIDSIVVRPIVTSTATAGRVWFGGMSTKSGTTSILDALIPLLDASKIGSGIFGTGFVPWAAPIDTIMNAIGVGGTGYDASHLGTALGFIPFENVVGVLGPADVGSSLQATVDGIVQGLNSVFGSGFTLAHLSDAAQSISSTATTAGTNAQSAIQTLGIQDNKAVSAGLEHTVESNMSISSLGTGATPNSVAVTSAISQGAVVRLAQAKTLGLTQFFYVSKSGTVTAFYLNFAKQDAATGNFVSLFSSGDLSTSLSAAGWIVYNWPGIDELAVSPSDVVVCEFQVVGSGTVNIAGLSQSWQTNHPTATTVRSGFTRNTGGSGPTALTVASGSISWTGSTPYIGHGVSTLPASYEPPTTTTYTGHGTYTYSIPTWAQVSGVKFDLILVGAGGGGHVGGTWGVGGNGGGAGSWYAITLVYGTDITLGTTTISVTVGTGGAQSSGNGTATTMTVTGHAGLSAAGGSGGSGFQGGAGTGASPGNETFDSILYFGGLAQNSMDTVGQSPGGGGGGGNWVAFGPGGAGADGGAWVRVYQP